MMALVVDQTILMRDGDWPVVDHRWVHFPPSSILWGQGSCCGNAQETRGTGAHEYPRDPGCRLGSW